MWLKAEIRLEAGNAGHTNKALALDWIACGDGSDWPTARGCLPILL